MPDFGDIEGLPPVTLEPTHDLGSLPWPWDMPAASAPGAAAIPGAVDVAAGAPAIPDAVTPQGEIVPAAGPGAAAPAGQPGELPLAAPPALAGAPTPAAPGELPATQPGLGIPRAALDPLVPPAPASPIPSAAPPIAPPGPSPDLAIPPPVVAAPAVEQPLTPTAGAPTPDMLGMAPPADLAAVTPSPLGEPGLPPAPSPLAPAPAILPGPVEPLTGQLEPGGLPSESLPAGVAAGARLTPDQRYAAVAGDYQRDPNKLLDRLEQPGVHDADTQRYLDEFAARDPAGAAVVRQRMVDAGATRAAADRARLAKEDFDKQMANLDRLHKARAVAAQKSAEIDAEATKIAETKIGYHPSTLQRIAGVVAAVLGGLYQGRTGSARNMGLDALNDIINRDLDEQKANLANRRDILTQRRSALGELNARTNDEYQSDEVMRLAALKYADQHIAQEQMNFAPDGTRGMNLAALRAGVNAQIAANKETRDGKLFDRAVKLQDAARQQDLATSTIEKNKADTAQGWAKIDLERNKDKADSTTWSPEQLKALNTVGGRVPPVPPIPMTQKAYSAWLGTQKEAEQFATAARQNNPNERARELAVSGVVDDTGQPVLYSESNIKAVRDGKETAEEMVRLTDDLVRMIKKNGWSSDFIKSKEWRQAKQNYGEIVIKKKEQDKLGVLTGPDVELVTKEIGTEDPTETRGQQAIDALLHFRQNQIEGINTKLRTQAALPEGRAIKRWDPPLNLESAPKSEEQAAIERLKAKPGVNREDARVEAGHDWLAAHPELPRNAVGQFEWTDAVRTGYNAAVDEAESQRHEVSPGQRRDLADLVRRASSGDPATRARVLELLAGVTKDGSTARIRQLAGEAAAEVRANTERPAAEPADPAVRDAQDAADRLRQRLGGQ